MADKTTNYELTKPLPNEYYDIDIQNANMDIIDEQLKERDTRVGPLTSLLTRIKTSIVNALNGLQGDLDEHKAENVTQVSGVHGLKIESGIFTPVINGSITAGTGTYTTQSGFYYKIGNLVHFRLHLTWTAHTGTGALSVGGLPFASNPNLRNSYPIFYNNLLVETGKQPIFDLVNSTSYGIVYKLDPTGGSVGLVNIDTSADIRISGVYSI